MSELLKFDQSKTVIGGDVITKFKNMPIDIPISCPKIAFTIGMAGRRCPGCEFFKGLLAVNPEAETFRGRYRVLCAYPIARSLGEPVSDLDGGK